MDNVSVDFGVGASGFGAGLGGFGELDDEFGGRFDRASEDTVQSSGRSRGFGDGSVELVDDLRRDAGRSRKVGTGLAEFGGGSQCNGHYAGELEITPRPLAAS